MSSTSKATTSSQHYFQFKASVSPCLVFEIFQTDLDGIKHHLAETVRRTPHFFIGAPVIIELEKIKSHGTLALQEIKDIMIAHGIMPVGIRGGSDEQQKIAALAGLPTVKTGKSAVTENSKNQPASTASKLITQPIRSGMQVYAKEGDLIVTTQVSPGAELMADGHIHVYGTLRGRALAGVHGNKDARIFCRSLESELVAIAGYYLTRDEINLPKDKNSSIQIYLKNEQLHVEPI